MPAHGNFILDKGYDAASAITKFRAVKFTANPEEVTQCTVLGENGVGVAQFGVTAAEITKGKGTSVRREGLTEWETGGVIAAGDDVTVDAQGRCVVAAATQRVWGKAEFAATGAGVRITVALVEVKYIKA
jgi:hypothetical protein